MYRVSRVGGVRSYSRPQTRPDNPTCPPDQPPASAEGDNWCEAVKWCLNTGWTANMAAYSLIFTIAGWWFGLIDSSNENISFSCKIFHQTSQSKARSAPWLSSLSTPWGSRTADQRPGPGWQTTPPGPPPVPPVSSLSTHRHCLSHSQLGRTTLPACQPS